ncbi:tetratricopeptide repeat protein [Nannocystaceae bacterium ST9]
MSPSLGANAIARLTLGLGLFMATSVGCLADGFAKTRRLHYIGDELVSSDPVPPFAYEAYLRARLALDRNPQDLAAARTHIDEALRWDPDEPQLWTTRAEIAWLAGDFSTAEASIARALELRPGYPAATRMQALIRHARAG